MCDDRETSRVTGCAWIVLRQFVSLSTAAHLVIEGRKIVDEALLRRRFYRRFCEGRVLRDEIYRNTPDLHYWYASGLSGAFTKGRHLSRGEVELSRHELYVGANRPSLARYHPCFLRLLRNWSASPSASREAWAGLRIPTKTSGTPSLIRTKIASEG